ncbi:MAG: hypothetical protein ACR2N1_18210 [Rubripirellula sp.]
MAVTVVLPGFGMTEKKDLASISTGANVLGLTFGVGVAVREFVAQGDPIQRV